MAAALDDLQDVLDYPFRSPALLVRALTHRSFANEAGATIAHYERLEFLGDAVVGLAVADELMTRFVDIPEGELSIRRSGIVNEAGLARAARKIDLGRHLRLGRGEDRSGGRDRDSLLADAFEAVMGAIFHDGGFDVAARIVVRLLGDALSESSEVERRDHKTGFQEFVQAEFKATPRYELISEEGPDHDKRFTCAVYVENREVGRGQGRSKKVAEHESARLAMIGMLSRNTDVETD